jgi:hypothetical protein
MQTVCAPFVPQAAATHGKNCLRWFSKPPPTRVAFNGKIGVTQESGIGERV